MRLTKYEKETIILFNEEDELASIYTYHNPGNRKNKYQNKKQYFSKMKI